MFGCVYVCYFFTQKLLHRFGWNWLLSLTFNIKNDTDRLENSYFIYNAVVGHLTWKKSTIIFGVFLWLRSNIIKWKHLACVSAGFCETGYNTTYRLIWKLLGEKKTSERKTHAPRLYSNCSQNVTELFHYIVGYIKFRGEPLEKIVGTGGVHLLKTIHRISENKNRR